MASLEHVADGLGQPFGRRAVGLPAAVASVPGLAVRRQPRPPQRLADIDVAEAGDQPLVHERRLERRLAAGEQAGERGAAHLVAERLDAERGEMFRAVEPGARHQVHQAEAARIVEDDADARRHVEDDMVVGAAAWWRAW